MEPKTIVKIFVRIFAILTLSHFAYICTELFPFGLVIFLFFATIGLAFSVYGVIKILRTGKFDLFIFALIVPVVIYISFFQDGMEKQRLADKETEMHVAQIKHQINEIIASENRLPNDAEIDAIKKKYPRFRFFPEYDLEYEFHYRDAIYESKDDWMHFRGAP